MRDDSHVIGAFSTLFAFSLPDALINGLEKVGAAVFTAILASYASNLVTRYMHRKTPKDP